MISLQHLHKDVKAFTVFQEDFSKKVKQLSDEAMNCIEQCVRNQVGAKNFEKVKQLRQKLSAEWMKKKNEYDQKVSDLNSKSDQLKSTRVKQSAEKARLEQTIKNLEKSVKHNTKQRDRCVTEKTGLDKMIIKI